MPMITLTITNVKRDVPKLCWLCDAGCLEEPMESTKFVNHVRQPG